MAKSPSYFVNINLKPAIFCLGSNLTYIYILNTCVESHGDEFKFENVEFDINHRFPFV